MVNVCRHAKSLVAVGLSKDRRVGFLPTHGLTKGLYQFYEAELCTQPAKGRAARGNARRFGVTHIHKCAARGRPV